MKTRKILLAVLALCLLSAVTVTGTLAVFSMKAPNPVTNTFVSNTPSLLRGPDKAFTLTESLVKFENGQNVLDPSVRVPSKEFPYNEYCIPVPQGVTLPQTSYLTLPKDPRIYINGRTNTPAVLYIEIVLDVTDMAQLNATLDPNWTIMNRDLPGYVFEEFELVGHGNALRGPHNGIMFYFDDFYEGMDIQDSVFNLPADRQPYSIPIFKNDEITFGHNQGPVNAFDVGLEIYAYLAEYDSDYWYAVADCFHRAFGFKNFTYED